MRRIKEGSARARRTAFALEYLEGRTLLSHVHAGPFELAAEVQRNFVANITGTIKGNTAPAALFTSTPLGFQGLTGHGPSSYHTVFLGLQYQPTVSSSHPTGLVLNNGSGVLTTAFGENINLQFTGTTEATSPISGVINLKGNVASGTGKFDGQTGTFTASGTVHPNGKFALSFAIYLNPRTS
jgi:hypothetical protein